jgi:hypothetical protein
VHKFDIVSLLILSFVIVRGVGLKIVANTQIDDIKIKIIGLQEYI